MTTVKLNKKIISDLENCLSYYLGFMLNGLTPVEVKLNLKYLYEELGRMECFNEIAEKGSELSLSINSIYYIKLILNELIIDKNYELDIIYCIEKERVWGYLNLLEKELQLIFDEIYSKDAELIKLDIYQSFWLISDYTSRLIFPQEYRIYKENIIMKTVPFTTKKVLRGIVNDYKDIVEYKENINVLEAFENYKSYLKIRCRQYFDKLTGIELFILSDNLKTYSPKFASWIESCKLVNNKNIFENNMWEVLGKS